ncbi:hypothetical protein Gpo141_00013826, partial [Globisporangium polare]
MKRQQRASSAVPSSSTSSRAQSPVDDHYLSGSAMMEHNDAPLAINGARQPSATPTLESPDQFKGGTNHDDDDLDEELFPVRVRFKRVTILLVSLVFVVIVATLMLICSGEGILIDDFKSADKNSDARKKLTDKYNSYSASVVAFLIKPLEMYHGM